MLTTMDKTDLTSSDGDGNEVHVRQDPDASIRVEFTRTTAFAGTAEPSRERSKGVLA